MLKVKIIFCEECMFRPKAEELKSHINNAFKDKVKVVIKKGREGDFEVLINGKLVFSIHNNNKLPTIEEITDIIKNFLLKINR